VRITLYGTRSSTYEYVKMMVKENAQRIGIDIQLSEVSDTNAFILNNIQRIPALKIEDSIIEQGKESIQEYIRELNMEIVKKENQGDLKNIVVPYDFSKKSENAILFAFGLAKQIGSTITLLNIYHPTPDYNQTLDTLTIESENDRRQRLNEYVKNLNKQWVGNSMESPIVYSDFRVGLAYDEIIKKSEEEPRSIFVLGTKNHSVSKKFFGSVSVDSGQKIKNITFIIPPDAKFQKIKKIVHCVETSELSDKIIDQLNFLCKRLKTELQLLHLREKNDDPIFDWTNIEDRFDEGINIYYTELHGSDKLVVLDEFAGKENNAILSLERGKRKFFQKLIHKSFTKKMTIQSKHPFLLLK